LLIIGVGKKSNISISDLQIIGANTRNLANDHKIKNIYFDFDILNNENEILTILNSAILSEYKFNKYITKKTKKNYVESFNLIYKENIKNDFLIEKSKAVSSGICLARNLINESPSVLNPVKFAEIALKIAKQADLTISILDQTQIKKENMNLMLAVSNASVDYSPPRFIKIKYIPNQKQKKHKHIILLGKGVTFDSGGLNLKPSSGIRDMKIDMSGAAAVLGTMFSIGKIKPNIAVTGYMACVENGISHKSYHPGDIVISKSGISVEIDNTDAEGRLILADSIDFIQKNEKFDFFIDIATLTGASMISLGLKRAAMYSNNKKLAMNFYECSKKTNEKLWPMPLDYEMKNDLESPVADIKNCGSPYGGSITAALFLNYFIKEKSKWIHLDIAGPAFNKNKHPYLGIGGSGFGVSTFIEFIMEKSEI
jgi:leucyl aminopeptidase